MKPLLTVRCHKGCKLVVADFDNGQLRIAGRRITIYDDVDGPKRTNGDFNRIVADEERFITLGCVHTQQGDTAAATLREWTQQAARGGPRTRMLGRGDYGSLVGES